MREHAHCVWRHAGGRGEAVRRGGCPRGGGRGVVEDAYDPFIKHRKIEKAIGDGNANRSSSARKKLTTHLLGLSGILTPTPKVQT